MSPSTITGIEVSGEDQPFGQNAYSRTSEQTYRDVAGVLKDTWTIGNNKVNEFTFQYARRGLSYFYNTQIPAGPTRPSTFLATLTSDASLTPISSASSSVISSLTTSPGPLAATTPSSAETFNYIGTKATFTVNYGGVYDFGSFGSANLGFVSPDPQMIRSQTFQQCRHTAQACPATSSRASAVPATHSPTSRWESSGKIRGGFALTSPSTMASATILSSRRSSSLRARWLLPPITNWDCRKGFRPIPTTFSLASVSPGIQKATARRYFALLTACSTTTRCWVFISWAMLPMAPPADSWPSVVLDFAAFPPAATPTSQSQCNSRFSKVCRQLNHGALCRLQQSGGHERTRISAQPAAIPGSSIFRNRSSSTKTI